MLDVQNDYELLDSGLGRKLERFGKYVFNRPCATAVWDCTLSDSTWKKADAVFARDDGNRWTFRNKVPDSWYIQIDGIKFKLSLTNFGHIGIFPEQRYIWSDIRKLLSKATDKRKLKVLNLFAYSGGSTLAAALEGVQVCHLDASKGMVARAGENARLNNLSGAPIRWIIDDVTKFLKREIRRGNQYNAIILDPPSFGRGKSGEVYKIERDFIKTIRLCVQLLSQTPFFLIVTSHTPSFSPLVLENVLRQTLSKFGKATYRSGEMLLTGASGVMPLPNGTYSQWIRR